MVSKQTPSSVQSNKQTNKKVNNQTHIRANNRRIGSEYETLAIEYLQKQALKLLNRNFSCKMGEIDLIFRKNDMIIFVEVRFRKNAFFGGPLMSVNYNKQQKLIRCAQFFLRCNPTLYNHPCRFDVMSITLKNGMPEIEWVQDAFQA